MADRITNLKNQIFNFTKDIQFKKSSSMGEILENALAYVKRNYEDVTSI